ncbi:MAG: histidine phosphatase family protein [Rhodobacteraceae bacterium]|nr:histidine phosphatase family protein [Paracoccaceae bacterium]
MTRLHLVRHGPTHAKVMVGWSDLPADLSDAPAIARLSAHLPATARIISSDLSRASATADAIQTSQTRLPHDPNLREINFGAWELRSHADIEAEDPDRIRAYWETPGEIRPPGGESWHQVCARVDKSIDDLTQTHQGVDLIIVAHFGVILTQLQRALRLGTAATFAHRIDNLSVTELIRHDQNTWTSGLINHLP